MPPRTNPTNSPMPWHVRGLPPAGHHGRRTPARRVDKRAPPGHSGASPLPCPDVHHRPPLRHLRLRTEGIPVHRVRCAVCGDAGAALQFMRLRSGGAAVREVPQAVCEHHRATVPHMRVRAARASVHEVRTHVLRAPAHASADAYVKQQGRPSHGRPCEVSWMCDAQRRRRLPTMPAAAIRATAPGAGTTAKYRLSAVA